MVVFLSSKTHCDAYNTEDQTTVCHMFSIGLHRFSALLPRYSLHRQTLRFPCVCGFFYYYYFFMFCLVLFLFLTDHFVRHLIHQAHLKTDMTRPGRYPETAVHRLFSRSYQLLLLFSFLLYQKLLIVKTVLWEVHIPRVGRAASLGSAPGSSKPFFLPLLTEMASKEYTVNQLLKWLLYHLERKMYVINVISFTAVINF